MRMVLPGSSLTSQPQRQETPFPERPPNRRLPEMLADPDLQGMRGLDLAVSFPGWLAQSTTDGNQAGQVALLPRATRTPAWSSSDKDKRRRCAVPCVDSRARGDDGTVVAPVYLLTGVQAAGKSTVAEALAGRFKRSVHVHGDVFRRWVVGGRVDPAPDAPDEAWRQLALRYRLTADVARSYRDAGFTVVVQDVVLGAHLPEMAAAIGQPVRVFVLDPDPEVVAERERARGKHAYDAWTVAALVEGLRRDTPRVGTWLDTSFLTVDQTVDAILDSAQ
jgi:predicted kinase